MPQILLIVVVILIAGFTARSCSKNEPGPGDPAKTVAHYEAHPNQAVADMVKCAKSPGGTLTAEQQRAAGIDCINAKTVMKVALEAEKKRRKENGTWPASAPESNAAK